MGDQTTADSDCRKSLRPFTTIETARLTLREVGAQDAPFFLKLLNEPTFVQFIGDKGVRTPDDARRHIAEGPVASYSRYGYGLLLAALRDKGEPIGVCGLIKRDYLDYPDLGFAFMPQYRRHGYGFEAASAVLQDVCERVGLTRVCAITQPDNHASLALLDRLGFGYRTQVCAPESSTRLHLFVLRLTTECGDRG